MTVPRFSNASSMDRTPRVVLSSLPMHSLITELAQTTTEFGNLQRARDSGQGRSGLSQYIVLLSLNIGYYALWTLSRSILISSTVSLRCTIGFRMSRYVFMVFVFYQTHV